MINHINQILQFLIKLFLKINMGICLSCVIEDSIGKNCFAYMYLKAAFTHPPFFDLIVGLLRRNFYWTLYHVRSLWYYWLSILLPNGKISRVINMAEAFILFWRCRCKWNCEDLKKGVKMYYLLTVHVVGNLPWPHLHFTPTQSCSDNATLFPVSYH